MEPRRIVFAVFPDFQILDLTGPHEVFTQANQWGGGYRIDTVAVRPGPVASSGGLAVIATATTAGPVDTLVVVGGTGTAAACADTAFVDWVTAAAGRARRVTSVCSGTFVLARAGLLDGRRAVTHWAYCDLLARQYPAVIVEQDPIFIRDGHVWTSAGVTAGIDLALALVREDLGVQTAHRIARQLVMFVQRPGGQTQFSTQLAGQRPGRDVLADLRSWIADHLADDLTVPALAARAGLSQRHLTRVFGAEIGQTPAAYVEAVRTETAQRLLTTTSATVEAIARNCGFGTAETMHRSFQRTLRVTPGQYRRHFTAA